MKHDEFLAANPDAQSAYDDALEAAKSEGVTAGTATGKEAGITEGQESVQAKITQVTPFLSSEKYQKPIRDLALQVLSGVVEFSALAGAAAAVDTSAEAEAAAKAADEQKKQKETAGDGSQHALSDDGVIRSEDDMAGAVARARGEAE